MEKYMKQLFMVLTVLLLLALPSYATAEKCDYTLTDKEIEKELNNLLTKRWQNKWWNENCTLL